MDNYNKIKIKLEENNCSLITSFNDFEQQRISVLKKSYHYVKIEFIGICGHPTSAIVTNFISRQTGIRCKECTKTNVQQILKITAHNSNNIELNSINIIKEYLLNKYDIIRTKEGCRADIIINKIGDSKYIPIQVKSTNSISNNKLYSFRCLNKDYTNMIIICICILENKIWVIPYKEIKCANNLNISMRSKYNKYLVSDNNRLYEYIEQYSNDYYTTDIDRLMTPHTILQQREQEYSKKRETHISFLNFKYPEVQNTSTDFIVNGKRVQEKVAGYYKIKSNPTLLVHFACNNGKKANGFRNFRTYRLGENDYYWIHSSIDNKFWIIPENILYINEYISETNKTHNRKVLYINNNTRWITDYEYTYDNIDITKIKDLFI
jgi:hypothetical protein